MMMDGTMMMGQSMALVPRQLRSVRGFLLALATAVPKVPAALAEAGRVLRADLAGREPITIGLLILLFVGCGVGAEQLLWWAMTGFRRRLMLLPTITAEQRLRAAGIRFSYGFLLLFAFSAGSLGVFLLFDWPQHLGRLLLLALELAVIVRLTLLLCRLFIAPGAPRFRIVPMATRTAEFWFVWSAVIVGYFFAAQFTLEMLRALAMPRIELHVVGIGLGVGLLALALLIVWTTPDRDTGARDVAAKTGDIRIWALSTALLVTWLLLFTGSTRPFYVAVICLVGAALMKNARLAVRNLMAVPEGSRPASRSRRNSR